MTRAARVRIGRREALNEAARRRGLLEWIPRVTPHFQSPTHLAPVAELLERAFSVGGVRAVVSAPPRQGKTELVDHGVGHGIARAPSTPVVIACHTQGLADRASRRVRDLVSEAGVELDPKQRARAEWRTRAGGGVKAVGVGGALVGHGASLLVVDDPIRSRVEAESAKARDALHEWLLSSALTRLEPNGSAIVIMHRWHEDDLAGRLVRDGWTEIVLPAIADEDTPNARALWPERYSLADLERIRAEVGPREWASLFQGTPRPSGEALFSGVHFYDAIPEGLAIGIGVDLAYSTRTASDYTSIVIVGRAATGVTYLLDVIRDRRPIEGTAELLRSIVGRYNGTSPRWYASGVERALADTIRALTGVHIDARIASSDKATRAQATSAAWARGHVLVPRSAPWLDAFISEICRFPHGRNDDQVDAFVAAFDSVAGNAWMWDGQPVAMGAGYRSTASGWFSDGGYGPTRPPRHRWWP